MCESAVMKERKSATQHGYKVGQFEIGYCFDSEIFGANIVWKLSKQTGPACGVSISKTNTHFPQCLDINPLLIENVCYLIKSLLHMKGRPNN